MNAFNLVVLAKGHNFVNTPPATAITVMAVAGRVIKCNMTFLIEIV